VAGSRAQSRRFQEERRKNTHRSAVIVSFCAREDQLDFGGLTPAGITAFRNEFMAHKKAGGSSRNGRDSNSQRLGVKPSAVRSSSGATHYAPTRHKVHAGTNVAMGKDHTLFAKIAAK